VRNFPGETTWSKAGSAWVVQLYEPHTKRARYIGYFTSEEEAARAYDSAAVQAHGAGAKRNFPGETVSSCLRERARTGSSAAARPTSASA
jgi:hypothetical protein